MLARRLLMVVPAGLFWGLTSVVHQVLEALRNSHSHFFILLLNRAFFFKSHNLVVLILPLIINGLSIDHLDNHIVTACILSLIDLSVLPDDLDFVLSPLGTSHEESSSTLGAATGLPLGTPLILLAGLVLVLFLLLECGVALHGVFLEEM